mmetsp:Transcript_2498/g.9718  ORF Transcript_2498/g.9718 Transcript_2498/m.9718 type:complete len:80 (-) Transcript_2498:273-512(-)
MRITIVRFIFVDLTTPVKMRPRMDTLPVNGHFLSMYVPTIEVKINQSSVSQSPRVSHQPSSPSSRRHPPARPDPRLAAP